MIWKPESFIWVLVTKTFLFIQQTTKRMEYNIFITWVDIQCTKNVFLWPVVVYFNRQEETIRLGLDINEKGKQIKCYYDQIQVSKSHKHMCWLFKATIICILKKVTEKKKKVSSTIGMQRSVDTSDLLSHRIRCCVPERIEQIKQVSHR